MDFLDVAILDNGVNRASIKNGLFFDMVIQNGSVNTKKDNEGNGEKLNHGSICAQILENNSDHLRISSIKILDKDGRGLVSNINVAFDWCINNNIKIINLSFGTFNFKDKRGFRSAINHYVNKGLIIIAASANKDLCTYPASFSNVIGVCSGEKISINKQIQAFKGIDFIAPSDHEIITECASFRLGKSNSYAAPYVTAMVGNLIYEKGFMTVDEIRNNLCVESNSFIYSPDWIESAWIAPNYRKSKAEYYFNADKRDLPECIDDIDTVVFLNAEDIEKYADIGKHIVYIGNDRVSRFDKKHHFWSRELRHEQIISSKERTGEIDIPSVCCIFDNQVDIIWCLCVLKELFENEGYNAFVGCDLVDSVLYDLEYLPDGDTIQEKLADFVYWQTYYQQSDIILAGTTDKDNDVIIVDKPDMVVYFNLEKNGITVKMFSDGEAGVEKYYTKLDIGSITKIYGDIIGSFEKEDE